MSRPEGGEYFSHGVVVLMTIPFSVADYMCEAVFLDAQIIICILFLLHDSMSSYYSVL